MKLGLGDRTMKPVLASVLLGLAVATATLVPTTAPSGPGAAAATPYRPPRGPDGHPDITGVWQVMNSANWDIEPHAARAALAMRPGPIVPVPAKEVIALGAVGSAPAGDGVVEGGTIPYKPEALAQRDQNRADYLSRDPEVKCYLPGVPRGNYMPYPFQIVRSGQRLLFLYEYDEAYRQILFKDPGPPALDSWMGQSVGKWEGDTLVVTVTGQVDNTWFDRAGNFHSGDMVVVERYTPTGPDTLRYEAEITDPQTFTRPWKMSMILYRRQAEDARLHQFKCVEFVEELLFGDARKQPLK